MAYNTVCVNTLTAPGNDMFAKVLTTPVAKALIFRGRGNRVGGLAGRSVPAIEIGGKTLVSTYMANPQNVERKWYVIDAEGMVMGRLASQVASMLRGKHKPTFTPHCDCGDYIIVVNTDKLVLTGKKLDNKVYRYHTGYPGGLKEIPYRKLMANKSEFAFREAVRRMLPKGPLGYAMAKKLFVFGGPEHNHQAQKPEALKL